MLRAFGFTSYRLRVNKLELELDAERERERGREGVGTELYLKNPTPPGAAHATYLGSVGDGNTRFIQEGNRAPVSKATLSWSEASGTAGPPDDDERTLRER